MQGITVGTTTYRYGFVTGRAAVGIFLSLQAFCPKGTVLVPANICYAAVYPVIYSGRTVRFCDVDPVTGNISLETLRAAWSSEVTAAIISHMYGQPVSGMEKIGRFCSQKHVFLIEDCASAMGACTSEYKLGSVGDCVLYSTGYAKTLDLGIGGLLCSDRVSLTDVEETEKRLSLLDIADEKNMEFFSKLYRFMRNQGSGTALEAEIYRVMYESSKGGFLYTIPEGKKEWVLSRLQLLPETIRLRREAEQEYRAYLGDCPISIYPYAEGAVPWRFNLLIEPTVRKRVIDACLEEKLPVSDWYPRVTDMFSCTEKFPGAEWHEKRILNFPLLIEKSQIRRICHTIRACL